MRILILADATMPTPADGTHGLGRITSIVAEGLLARGHDAVLIAKHGSTFSGAMITVDCNGYDGERDLAREALKLHREFPADVILDNGHLHYLSLMMPALPIVNVYHDRFQPYARCPILLSEGQRALMSPEFETARIIHNALNPADYEPFYDPTTPEYALFMGAISELKQPFLAIEACARLGLKLVMAGQPLTGKIPVTHHSNAEYVGMATGKHKADLYRHAKVFLQLGTDESFGITTLEAALSGTPVVAWPSGGNLDLVRYGVSGAFVIAQAKDKVQATCDAIERASFVPRQMCRAWGEALCQPERQIDLYEDALGACAKGLWW